MGEWFLLAFASGAARERLVLELESPDFHSIAKMTHRISHADNAMSKALAFFHCWRKNVWCLVSTTDKFWKTSCCE